MRPHESASQDGPPDAILPAAPPSWAVRDAPETESVGASRLAVQDAVAARRAARYAEHAYEGPIGDLIARELRAFAEAGDELPPHAMGPRLVSLMTKQEARHPLPPPRTYTHLPAQYVPGTPMHWRYRSLADVEEPGADAP